MKTSAAQNTTAHLAAVIWLAVLMSPPAFAQQDANGLAPGHALGANPGAFAPYRYDPNDYTWGQAWQQAAPHQDLAPLGASFPTDTQSQNGTGHVTGAISRNGPNLPFTTWGVYGNGPGAPLGILPDTNLDSFIYQSGMSYDIYGDEGDYNPPPLQYFQYGNTIGSGIYQPGLTTGHASILPSSWLDTTSP